MAKQISLLDILSELKKTSYRSNIKGSLVETILEGQPVYTFITDWDRLTVSTVSSFDGRNPIAPLIAANETMRAVGYVRIFVQSENDTVLFGVDFTCNDVSQILPCFSRGMEVIKSAKESFKSSMMIISLR